MKFIGIISKLLGMPKMLKKAHTLELDIVAGEEAICLKHYSYNQSDTIMFLKAFYVDLNKLRKNKEKELSLELKKELPLIIKMFTLKGRNYLLKKDSNELITEIHLINLRLVNDKKTISLNNIEKNINQLGSKTIESAIKRFMKNKKKR